MKIQRLLSATLAMLPALTLLGGLPAQLGAEEAVKISYSFFIGGKADAKDLSNYSALLEQLEQLTSEEDPRGLRRKQLEVEIAQLKAALGQETEVTYWLTQRTARISTRTGNQVKVEIVRLDQESKWAGMFLPASKNAVRYHFDVLKANTVNAGVNTTVGEFPKHKDVMGKRCTEYYMLGGVVYAHTWDQNARGVVQLFVYNTRIEMNGFRGELLWLIVNQVDELPILGSVSLPKGLAFGGSMTAGNKVAFMLRECEHFKDSFEEGSEGLQLEIPEDKKTKDFGFPKQR